MPTVLDVIGVEPPPAAQGLSLVPTFYRDVSLRRAVRSGETLITLDWKLLDDRGELLPQLPAPQWQENQYARQPDRVSALERLLGGSMAEDVAARRRLERATRSAPPIDGALRDRLRSLGYLGH